MSEREEARWKLEELAERAGVSPRTVRYYVQRGLLPAPVFRGRDTAYGVSHLERLRAVRRLQERFLPLDAIQAELDGKTPAEIRALADGADGSGGNKTARRGGTAAVGLPYRTHAETGLSDGHGERIRGGDDGAEERWTRWRLAPGLELQVSEGADAATRTLAAALRAEAARVRGTRGDK